MKKNINFIILLVPLVLLFSQCGIQPPTQDLELAKTKIAEAEQVEANQYATDEYNKSKELLDQGSSKIVNEKSGKNKDAKKLLVQSKEQAEKAYEKAAPPFAQKNISEAENSLSQGKNIKADVAAKEDYSQAEQMINESKQAFDGKDFKNAAVKSKTAKEIAERAYQTTLEKKNKAENAINDARNSINEIESSK